MAVVWLNQNINVWNTPSAFDYWDEATQTIQPYNQVPQSGDTFYFNGYSITATQNISAQWVKFSNYTNPYTGIGGGNFIFRSNTLVCKEIEVGNDTFAASGAVNNTVSPNFIADINLIGIGGLYNKGGNGNCSVTINGNVYRNGLNAIIYGNNGSNLVINGNYESENVVGSAVTNALTINGNCTLRNTSINGGTAVSTIKISGDITIINNRLVNVTSGTTTLSGHNLYYDGDFDPIRGFILNSVIFNSDSFSYHNLNDDYETFLISKYQLNNTNQYPSPANVKKDVPYAWGELVGQYLPDYPPESVVLDGYVYDNGDKTGSMSMQAQVGCVTKEDVREGVPLLGMGEVGTLVVPSVDDVREGVVFDNGSVGTLIVQGGGDRLRIADFGYYTNAQSDTYIVDLTEQDKPKFAVAEERVLIEMFPDLDLDNIPDKYFDDLFVKYLKYRLIVEYYRTAGINSTFTPSEPTTEIVNYQNVRNEVWLNSANIYLKAWGKKYPESITKPQRILL